MKKLPVAIGLVVLLFSVFSASIANVSAQGNILLNPGFENGLSNWQVTSGNAVYTTDAASHSGSYSVKGVETAAGSIGRLYQDVTARAIPGEQYQISGWIKTSDVTGRVILGLDYVTQADYTTSTGYIAEIGNVNGTQDWTFFQSPPFTLKPMPSDSAALYFLFDFNNGNGTAWWDDVSLVGPSQTSTSTPEPSGSPMDSWATFGHDVGGARYSLSTAPRTNQVLWSTALDSQIRGSVSIVGNNAYIASFSGTVYALDASTGAKIWDTTLGGSVWSSPAVANGIVYVGSNDGNVYALNAANGDKVWNFTTGEAVWSSPSLMGNILYVGSVDNNLYALDAATGAKIWNYTTGGQIRDSPAVANNVVYVGSQDGTFYALNASTGDLLWSSTTGDGDTYTNSSPAVVNGVVYVGSTDTNLYAFRASDGSKIWSYPTNAKVSSSPAVFNGVVYVGSEDGSIYAIDSSSGTKIWSQTTGGPVYSSPAVANGIVYVGSWGDTVYAFDASTGGTVWSYRTGGGVFSSPSIAGGVMFIGSYDGKVYAFGTSFSPTVVSSPYPSDGDVTKTAWVPSAPNGIAASVVAVSAVGITSALFAAASSAPAGAANGFFDKIIDKIRELVPETVKKWLEDFVASKRKLKVDEKKGSPYLPTKSEALVYGLSILFSTFAFSYVKVSNLDQILIILPSFFATSILVSFARTYILATYSRRRGVWTEYKLWYFGLGLFLVSTLAFRTPFSSPTRTVHHSRNFTERLGGFLSCAALFITLGFGAFFFVLYKSGFALIGGTGLGMCLISAFFDTFPIEPMGGKDIFKYSKLLWGILFAATLSLYILWIAHLM